MRCFIIVIPLVFFGFLCAGVYVAWDQHHKITTYTPVRATVVAKEVRGESNGHGRTYRPVITYRYQVGNRTYTSERATADRQSSTYAWAQGICNRYQVGQVTEAYYNDQDPSDAFLYGHYSFFPYFVILYSWFILMILAGATARAMTGERVPNLQPVEGGWYEVAPEVRLSARKRYTFLTTVLWHLGGASAWGHYFCVAGAPYGIFAVAATLVYEAAGLAPLLLFARYYRLGRIVGATRLLVNRPHSMLGSDIAVHVEQESAASLQIDELSVALVCRRIGGTQNDGKTSNSDGICHEDRVALVKDRAVGEGEVLVGDHAFRIPPDGPPSSLPGQKGLPTVAWHMEVKTRVPGRPVYEARFPVVVRPAGAA